MIWKLKIAAFLISVSVLVSIISRDIVHVGSLNSTRMARRLRTRSTWSLTSIPGTSYSGNKTGPSPAPTGDFSELFASYFSLSFYVEAITNVISAFVEIIDQIISPSDASTVSSSPSKSSTPSFFTSTLPSQPPSFAHSDLPSSLQSEGPSGIPSGTPSSLPSEIPSTIPSMFPSSNPSMNPSRAPSNLPSKLPSEGPSSMPSDLPSQIPSNIPSLSRPPSQNPSVSFEPTQSFVWTIIDEQIVGENDEQIGKNLAITADGSRIVQSGEKSLKVYDLSTTWSESATLSSIFSDSEVKISIAMTPDGLSIVAGQPQDDGTGFACLFVDDGSSWTNVGNITDPLDEHIGSSVGISDDGINIFVGADGDNGLAVYQYSHNGTTISYEAKIEGGTKSFGFSLSIDSLGTMIIIGSPYDGSDLSGSAFIYNMSNPSVQVAEFNGNIGGGEFGHDVSMSNDGFRVAVGAIFGEYMQVYEWNEDTNLYETIAVRVTGVKYFGGNVALSGDGKRLAVTAQKFGASSGGRVYLYLINKNVFIDSENIGLTNIGPITSEQSDEKLGSAVAMNHDGTLVVCGAKAFGSNQGAIRMYEADR